MLGSSAAGRVWSVAATSLEIEGGDAVDDRDVRARRTLEWPAIVVAAAGPRERRRRTGSPGRRRRARKQRAQPIPPRRRGPRATGRAPGERELGGAEAIDEVAASDATSFLQRTKDRIDRGEAAVHGFGGDGLTCRDAMALEEGERLRVEAFRRRGVVERFDQRDPRPAASGGPRAVSRPGRPRRAPEPEPEGRFQRRARSGANVSLVTSPAHTRSQSASSISRSDPPPAAAWMAR